MKVQYINHFMTAHHWLVQRDKQWQVRKVFVFFTKNKKNIYIYINYIYTEKMYLKIKLLKHIYLIVYFFRALFADECQKSA